MTGKSANRPFLSLAGLAGYLESPGLFPSKGAPTGSQIAAALGAILVVRSDTFRLRAYGDAVDPVDGTVQAACYCEAVVQRTPQDLGAPFGRRFAVTYFRWLGPNDI